MPARKSSARSPVRAGANTGASAKAQLDAFIGKFGADDQRHIRAVRQAMRKRLPTANELVWDNYNFFVIGYSPSERPYDAPLSIAAKANGLSLCFLYGAALRDPQGMLEGSGKQTRFIRIHAVDQIADPAIEELIAQAVSRAKVPFPEHGGGKLIVRSVSEKQRPRQKSAVGKSASRQD